jgi:hypothetical protein
MFLERDVIQHKGFRNLKDASGNIWGFQVCIRQPLYRGTWLSEFRFDNVTVDGERFGSDAVSFTISGLEYTYDELAKFDRVMWPLDEMCFIHVKKPGGLQSGLHQVHVNFFQIRSYFPPSPDQRSFDMNEKNATMNAQLILV